MRSETDDGSHETARRWRRDRQHAAQRLRELRTAAGLSQRALALRSGVGYALISRYESAKVAPNATAIRRLADALRVDPTAYVAVGDGGAADSGEPVMRHGELGRVAMNEAGDLRCHLCGEHFAFLATHAGAAHGLSADEYRAVAGLKATTPLASAAIRDALRERAVQRVGTPAYERLRAGHAAYFAQEAEHRPHRSYRQRPETTRDPAWRAAMAANAAKARAARAELRAGAAAPAEESARPTANGEEQVCRQCGRVIDDPTGRARVVCSRACLDVRNRARWAQGHAVRQAWGADLRARRRAAGLTGTALARAVGVDPSVISHLESGRAGPTGAQYAGLKAALPDLADRPPSVMSYRSDLDEPT